MAEWWQPIKDFQTNIQSFFSDQAKGFAKGLGFVPEYDTSTAGQKLAPPSKQDVSLLEEGIRRLSPEEQAYFSPRLDAIRNNDPLSRDYYDEMIKGLDTKRQGQEQNKRLETMANNLTGIFDDPKIAGLLTTVNKGTTTDLFSQDDINRMVTAGTEQLSKVGKDNINNIRTEAANRGILSSGGALESELMSSADIASRMGTSEVNTRTGMKGQNDTAKGNWAKIGTALATLKGDVTGAAQQILAGQVVPSVNLASVQAAIQGILDQSAGLDYLNQTAASGGIKDIMNMIMQLGDNASSDALSLLGILKSNKGGGSSGSSGMGAAFTAAGGSILGGLTGNPGLFS